MTIALRFDTEAIAQAKQQLNIRKPVHIRSVKYRHDGQIGWYEFRDGAHYITLVKEASEPNNALWHELAHAAQAEQVSDIHKEYHRVDGGLGAEYLHNQFEIEARIVASTNCHKILVTREDVK